MIIVSVTGPSMPEAFNQIASSVRYADIFELRLDLLPDTDVRAAIRATRKPVIATCRPVREGGSFEGPEVDRFDLLQRAIDAGARYVDLELDAWTPGRRQLRSRVSRLQWIVSHHSLGSYPRRVDVLYKSMMRTGAEVLKFAYTAEDAWQIKAAMEFLALARGDGKRALAIAMGEAGEASRVLYKVFGGWATFACPERGRQSAPGQLPASALRNVFRAHERTTRTKVFGLVGNPVGQSKGPYIHNVLYRRLDRDAIYCRFRVDNLPRFMKSFEGVLQGCSVTVPHKQAMMRLLSQVDPDARRLGAVNTVVRRATGYFGANTDASGALDAIEGKLLVAGKRCLVIGAGGAARAIAGEAIRRGATVCIANRTLARARSVARALGAEWTTIDGIPSFKPEILVNATSAGMWPDIDVSPVAAIPDTVHLAFDAIYNPVMTCFLEKAGKQGIMTVTGVEMFARQAVEQIRLFTGRKPLTTDVKRLFVAATRDPVQDSRRYIPDTRPGP